MKNKVPWALFLLCLIWALTATFLLTQKATMTSQRALLQEPQKSEQLENLERIAFLRQFLDQYLTYNSANYWQTQTALAFLMTPELRNDRLQEIQRLKTSFEKRDFNQRSDIQIITELGKDSYVAQIHLSISRDKMEENLFSKIQIHLQATERTVENPWGLIVSNLKFQEMSAQQEPPPDSLLLNSDRPLILTFPCAVGNFMVPKDSPLKIKIVTMNVSEIQIFLSHSLLADLETKAFCQDRIFSVKLSPSSQIHTLFASLHSEQGERISDSKERPHKKKNPYQKTIEDQLDFVIEE